MKKIALVLLFVLPFLMVQAQNLKPYIVGYESNESISTLQNNLIKQLEANGIKVTGQYQPANDKNRLILVITSADLETAVAKVGGLTGFAATLRVALTTENNKTIVSYTNPFYWGNAYFRSDFDKVAGNYASLSAHLEAAMKALGNFSHLPFGSKKGLSANELRKYHYMMAMPYFDDVVELGKFDSYAAAVTRIDENVKKGIPDVKLVSKVTIPGKNLTLYNFGLSGEKGESKFLPIIDITAPKQTAFLPYEVLVTGNKVVMLHGRYRIALSFPDLTMMTFTKIMSTPGNIETLLKQVVK